MFCTRSSRNSPIMNYLESLKVLVVHNQAYRCQLNFAKNLCLQKSVSTTGFIRGMGNTTVIDLNFFYLHVDATYSHLQHLELFEVGAIIIFPHQSLILSRPYSWLPLILSQFPYVLSPLSKSCAACTFYDYILSMYSDT